MVLSLLLRLIGERGSASEPRLERERGANAACMRDRVRLLLRSSNTSQQGAVAGSGVPARVWNGVDGVACTRFRAHRFGVRCAAHPSGARCAIS